MRNSIQVRNVDAHFYKPWKNANEIASIAWAAEQVLMHNCDNTVNANDIASMTADMLNVIRRIAAGLCEELDQIPVEINALLKSNSPS